MCIDWFLEGVKKGEILYSTEYNGEPTQRPAEKRRRTRPIDWPAVVHVPEPTRQENSHLSDKN